MSDVRSPFHGMGQILRYNRHVYVLAAVALAALALGAALLPIGPWAWFAAALVAAGVLVSLAVSHIVYDRSSLHAWTWLELPAPSAILVIHAGLDEASDALRRSFPAARMTVLDIHDQTRMGEPAIRAARAHGASGGQTASHADLPVGTASADLVTLFFVAHELRAAADRVLLLAEVRRAMAPGGRAVVVEHLRDVANTLAFGPGVFHFFPRSRWVNAFAAAGLAVAREARVTPFVRVFFLEAS